MQIMNDPKIVQVVGCAYTYKVSQAVRARFSKNRADHSSHQGAGAFSYFKKIEKPEDIRRSGESLVLRVHPGTGQSVDHWYEPELAILLGPNHRIIGYALANDLTASGVEFEAAGPGYDPTYFAKCWPGSCGLGKFVAADSISITDLLITLHINNPNRSPGRFGYSTSRRLREFHELPGMILEYRLKVLERCGIQGVPLPRSKDVLLDGNGNLPEGTVILTGTGMILPRDQYAISGDTAVIRAEGLPDLFNKTDSQSITDNEVI